MGDSSKDNVQNAKSCSRSRSRKRQVPSKNPFVNYVTEFRQQNKNVSGRDLFKIAGERWRKMSEQERAPYRNAAQEAKDKDPKVRKPKGEKKGNSNKKTEKGKKQTKKRSCSKCGHRHGSLAEDSAGSQWDKDANGNESASSKSPSPSRSRSRSKSKSKSDSLTQDDSEEYFSDDTSTTF